MTTTNRTWKEIAREGIELATATEGSDLIERIQQAAVERGERGKEAGRNHVQQFFHEASLQPELDSNEKVVAEILADREEKEKVRRAEAEAILLKPQALAAQYTTKTNRQDRQSVTSRKEEEVWYNGVQIS